MHAIARAWLAGLAALAAGCASLSTGLNTGPNADVGGVQAAAGPTSSASSAYAPKPYSNVQHADWARDAVIYQINTRQFTPEGTFKAAQAELPRLQELGVDILWLMPIHPIGEVNRKGTLGSPYSVKDYYGVNPEFGALDDLKAFIADAQARDMKVILDWVANHTAWDNPLASEHPDWYVRDWKGDFRSTPWWDWSDIIDLDFDQAGVREYMTKAMVYWVEDVGVDGFRCDVAGYVPLDFWNQVRAELDAIKPVFMLAEWDQRDAHQSAFDATYAWGWNNALHAITTGGANTGALYGFYSGNESAFPREAFRLMHVSNHDQNAWDGTMFERFGEGLNAAIVLSFVGEGIPMIYNGMEAGNARRLAFFEKDPIAWKPHPIGDLYAELIALKTRNAALWNGADGAPMVQVLNSASDKVFSFARQHPGGAGVFAAFNLSGETIEASFGDGPHVGPARNFASGEAVELTADMTMTLEPWSYAVFERVEAAQ